MYHVSGQGPTTPSLTYSIPPAGIFEDKNPYLYEIQLTSKLLASLNPTFKRMCMPSQSLNTCSDRTDRYVKGWNGMEHWTRVMLVRVLVDHRSHFVHFESISLAPCLLLTSLSWTQQQQQQWRWWRNFHQTHHG